MTNQCRLETATERLTHVVLEAEDIYCMQPMQRHLGDTTRFRADFRNTKGFFGKQRHVGQGVGPRGVYD